MSLSQAPSDKQGQSFTQRAMEFWARLIEPDPSVIGVGEIRRAQLLAVLTLVLTVLFASAIFSRPRSIGVFLALGGVTLVAYILSRTRYYRLGSYLLAYSFTAIAYLRIYQGTAGSIESSVASTVHIALVLASVLLSPLEFLTLAFLTTVATFAAPYYSQTPVLESDSIARTGGVVLVLSAMLYGIQAFRSRLEKDELKNLAAANFELQAISSNLEDRIRARTSDLEEANQTMMQRATRFQVISEISQEISSNVEEQPKELLNQIARSISEKLGFYHVGIFLIDATQEYAVLQATNSPGGQRMLERRHQLKVGGTGIVGYVSQSGYPRIALDTGLDAVFFNNPDLPETRSEIALPLKYGLRIIGVLDVQSTLQSAFRDEDTSLLVTLANQLAIVINNVLFLEQSGLSPASPQSLRRESQRQAAGKTQAGYSYLPDGTISDALSADNAFVQEAISSGEAVVSTQPSSGRPAALAIPVKFRDLVIGVIHIEASDTKRRWTENEIAMVQSISDRAGFALENARLFEDTVRRADQEQTIARVTAQIGASTDFNRILQTTIQELGQALGASRSFIQLGTNHNGQDSD